MRWTEKIQNFTDCNDDISCSNPICQTEAINETNDLTFDIFVFCYIAAIDQAKNKTSKLKFELFIEGWLDNSNAETEREIEKDCKSKRSD